ncbi:TPA: restriction endonuclease subunit S [Vibrio cholerae]|uniref:restriction endonuclease subunit S n=1 Tax=Vibrio cholerae TaxID=666 RepID=UPI0011D8BCF1|nr:restriction endonuclease subunit S [Vibrio cholerae]EGR2464860.1 restriction endonuclease subunit S [Vibrio cholerae]EGR5122842.1 restriction endonuclease subunit S [Vibrio cholerae]TXZ13971.1 restriction endonuclease subunit S [Vibrio cholerae]
MSVVNFMENLLAGAEIGWPLLGEVTKYEQPTKYLVKAKNYSDEFAIPVLTAGKTFILGYTDETSGIYNASENPVIIFDDFTTANKWVDFDFKAKSSAMKMISSNDETKYLLKYVYYWLNTLPSELVEGDHKRQWISNYANKKIPIPCPENPKKSLEIQAEIVRILDAFTELTAELTAELNLRKKQYNYYRDQLLSFAEGDVEWKTLGDVTKKWYSGGTPTARNPEYYEGGDIPWLRTQEVKFSDIENTEVKITQSALDNSSAKWIPKNCVIIAISGATAGRSAINKIPLATNQHCGCLEIDSSKALYRYVFHWVSYNYENIKALGQGARGDLNSSIIKNFKLPIPFANDPEKSLKEQTRIVAILDKFDALTNSITEGLPREIELRQKQYEYYRDLLLSFPKPNTEVAA